MRRLLPVLLLSLFSIISLISRGQVAVQDSLALVDLYNSTDGANWNYHWNLKDPVSTWADVGVINNRVVNLYLAGGNLIGKIPQSLGDLTSLKFLSLNSNYLSDTIPYSIGRLSSIEQLYLGGNQLTGNIPDSLGNLTTLITLELQNNQFSGIIPAALGSLTNLTGLSLSGNQLSGTIPLALEKLTNLTYLDVSNNQLSGYVPLLVNPLFHLSNLNITRNHFTYGGIEQIASYEKTTTFYPTTYAPQLPVPLYHNSDSTRLYVSVGGTATNNTFKLYKNDVVLGIQVGDSLFTIHGAGDYRIEITNSIAKDLTLSSDVLTKDTTPFDRDSLALVDLYNSTSGTGWQQHGNWLTSSPLSTWYGVTMDSGRVTALDLSSNQLFGSLPLSIGSLSSLTHLSLAFNQIVGSLPVTVESLRNLSYCSLTHNALTGDVPSFIGSLSKLRYLSLANNQFSGTLPPTMGNLSNLDTLYLGGNQISGAIPASFGDLSNLSFLNLNSMQLSGAIPSSIGNLTNLTYLSMINNQLSDSLPSSLGKLTKLTFLILDQNRLTGSIPPSLGKISTLQWLGLSGNNLGGTVRSSLDSFSHLQHLDISGNHFTFSGMEGIAKAYYFASYKNQDDIPLNYYAGTYSVYAGGTLANNTYKWYNSNDDLVAQKKGDSTFTPKTPDDYYVEVTNSIATQLTLSSDDLVEPIAEATILPASPATLFASREETDTSGWTNYYYDNNTPGNYDDDILVLSLQKRGQNIGSVNDGTFKVQLTATDSAGSNTGIKLTNPLITNPSGYWVMNRFWQVTPTIQPKNDVGVRFYYNNQDVSDINGSYPSHNLENNQLIFYKEVGGSPDPTTNLAGATKIISIVSGTYPSDTTWTYHSLSDTSQYAEFDVASFSGGGGGGTANHQVLPITLLYFTATTDGSQNKLQWSTANETNASSFAIERSTDGVSFIEIGQVKASGNGTATIAYSFSDKQPYNGTIYYRLKVVDNDNSYSYSEVRNISRNISVTVHLYPNPVQDNLQLHFTSNKARQLQLMVVNAEGKTVLTRQVSLPSGYSEQSLNVMHLSTGVYYVVCDSDSTTLKLKLIKIKSQ